MQDTVPRFWDAIDDFSFNVIGRCICRISDLSLRLFFFFAARWIRDNIVAAVLLFTTLLWIPASLIFRFYVTTLYPIVNNVTVFIIGQEKGEEQRGKGETFERNRWPYDR